MEAVVLDGLEVELLVSSSHRNMKMALERVNSLFRSWVMGLFCSLSLEAFTGFPNDIRFQFSLSC